MSLSRQVLSSPFDVQQRPRTAASRQNGDRKRVKEGGSSLANSNNMVDTRVIRKSTFNASTAENTNAMESNEQSGCILFDSRLINGDVFANPIVTVTGQQHSNGENQKQASRGTSACGRRTMSTPPPVKGRCHISVQTDGDTDTIEIDACEQSSLAVSCAQTDLQCLL
mmetsp:Transcript_2439/g.5152  ORF Transcript_2439/g.5152 Transcript_2439/m.5152 type:complete len:168 (-) Transcript_2439:363-866(-)